MISKTIYSPKFCADDFEIGPVYLPVSFLKEIKGTVNSLRIVRVTGGTGETVMQLEIDLLDEQSR